MTSYLSESFSCFCFLIVYSKKKLLTIHLNRLDKIILGRRDFLHFKCCQNPKICYYIYYGIKSLQHAYKKEKETFTPIGKTVGMYSCGPTVYNYAHIGNMRAYIFMDTLRRALNYNGFKVKSVMNITDVGHLLSDGDTGEDKMEKSAREQKSRPYEIAETIAAQFFADLKSLNISRPTVTPKATDNIPEMIEIVKALLERDSPTKRTTAFIFPLKSSPNTESCPA